MAQDSEEDLKQVRKIAETGNAPAIEVTRAEIRLHEAQIRLAEAGRDSTQLVRLLEELIKLRETESEQLQQAIVEGRATFSDRAAALNELREARIRLQLERAR